MTRIRFSVAAPILGIAEERAVLGAVRDGYISRGPMIARFESAFETWIGSGHAVAVNTGTSAIEVAMRALGLSGQEVVTGAMSCQATANALIAAGCRIRFADHDEVTWQVSAREIERSLTKNTRAIIIAHLYGDLADLDHIRSIARRRKLILVEDCAQAMGATWRNRPAGVFGDASTFSFYANKLITTGEGGMVILKRGMIAKRAFLLRDYGQDSPFHHIEFALNWKMPNILASLGTAQLRRARGLVTARRRRARLLRSLLSRSRRARFSGVLPEVNPAPFCLPIVLADDSGARIRAALARHGVETRRIFPPQFDQPSWIKSAPAVSGDFPVARRLAEHGLYLSVSPHLTLDQIREMAAIVLDVVK